MPASVPLVLRHRIGGYSAYEPARELGPAVEGFWTYSMPPDFSRPEGAMHRVLPDPSMSIAFCFGRQADGTPSDARVVLIGEKTRPKVFCYERRREIVAMRLKVEWAWRLIGVRPGEHNDEDVDLGLIAPLLAEELLENLSRTRTPADAIAALRLALRHPGPDDADVRQAVVAHALDVVRATRGRHPVEQIADRAGFSVRHLRRLVSDSAGVSLKRFARATRFVTAVTAADAVGRPLWAQIAAEAGFYDQSHLVRDCQAICGMTPTELHRERRAQVIAPALLARAPAA